MYEGTYELIGQECSMFTRKLEAQLCYQKIPYRWLIKSQTNTEEIEKRAGTRFIPALKTPDGWMVTDTIALGPFLHDRFNEVPVVPTDPAQRGACFVLEDFFNHWYPRHALHSRWCYPDNVVKTGVRFGTNILLGKHIDVELTDEEFALVEDFGEEILNSFGLAACEVQGAGPEKKSAIQNDFGRLLNLLSEHLMQNRFLLGDRACLADFALAGPFKAHFLLDPEPRGWLGKNLSVMEEYVDRIWAGSDITGEWELDDGFPESLLPLFDYAQNHYQVFARSSIEAAAKGEKFFELDLGDGPFVARSMKRLEKARLHVADELKRFGSINSSLSSTKVMDFYLEPKKLI